MKYVLLSSFDNYIDAHIALGRLEDAYINCHLRDDHSVTLNPFLSNAIGGIKLMVAESQASRATEVLAGN
ncbi:MAG: hypothetical protein EOO09_17955 [Chitinophagaceae bacterium]|nr:MAG: hypothetical protein EOO09_17955 [Chitinophagaceae bacterium]